MASTRKRRYSQVNNSSEPRWGKIREKDPLNKIQIIRGRVAESRVTGTVREVEEHMVGADRFQLLPRQNEEERKASEERLVKKKKPILLGIWP